MQGTPAIGMTHPSFILSHRQDGEGMNPCMGWGEGAEPYLVSFVVTARSSGLTPELLCINRD